VRTRSRAGCVACQNTNTQITSFFVLQAAKDAVEDIHTTPFAIVSAAVPVALGWFHVLAAPRLMPSPCETCLPLGSTLGSGAFSIVLSDVMVTSARSFARIAWDKSPASLASTLIYECGRKRLGCKVHTVRMSSNKDTDRCLILEGKAVTLVINHKKTRRKVVFF
jgi:hypothetical protein